MIDPLQDAFRHLVPQSYRPFERPSDLVRALLRALVDLAGPGRASVQLANGRETIQVPRGTGVEGRDAVTRTLRYRERELGELSLWIGTSHREMASDLLDEASPVLSRLLLRYEARDYARAHLGRDVWLVGAERALLDLEERIERVSALPMPLLIESEFGCEDRAVAVAVHVASRPIEPLVELACGEVTDARTFRAALAASCERLGHGTLFLPDVDELDHACQKVLLEELLHRELVQRWPDARRAPAVAGRVIASASHHLRDLVDRGAFSPALWSALDFVTVRLPPLRDRCADIPHWVAHFMTTDAPPASPVFSTDAIAMLSAHEWRGNLAELARVVARLAAITGSGSIGAADVREWAPELCVDAPVIAAFAQASPNSPSLPALSSQDDDGGGGESTADETTSATALGEIARQLLAGHLERLAPLHPGMRRAVTYLVAHFQEEISLDQLAHESFVSTSYLSALFKRTVGSGFKRFQSIVRVERAKQLLVDDPHQRITDISLEVGFGDFSHFLKTFKRLVQLSPREFRKRHGPPAVVRLSADSGGLGHEARAAVAERPQSAEVVTRR